jgi:uncharacterized membrane protein
MAYIDELDRTRIESAIASAEKATSGEVRVVILPGKVPDAVAAAAEEFQRLGMHDTAERNAVLIAVAPDAHQFALYGDAGVHARCGQGFWQDVAGVMEARFRAGHHTEAIIGGVARVGELLAKEFPRRDDDRDELPNEVITRPPVI